MASYIEWRGQKLKQKSAAIGIFGRFRLADQDRFVPPPILRAPVKARLIFADPPTAIPRLNNETDVSGSVVVIKRGGATFSQKYHYAVSLGASAVIIANNTENNPRTILTMAGTVEPISLNLGIFDIPTEIYPPCLMISFSAYRRLQAEAPTYISLSGFQSGHIPHVPTHDIANTLRGCSTYGFDDMILNLLKELSLREKFDKEPVLQKMLNDAEADRGATAMHICVEEGKPSSLALLLQYGANTEAIKRDGYTALHIAAQNEQSCPESIDCAALLVDAGAYVDHPLPCGWTAVHIACKFGSSEILELLVQAGANLRARAVDGCTPLHVACIHGRFDCVLKLLKAGVDPTDETNAGVRAATFALYGGHAGCVVLIEEQARRAVEELATRRRPVRGLRRSLSGWSASPTGGGGGGSGSVGSLSRSASWSMSMDELHHGPGGAHGLQSASLGSSSSDFLKTADGALGGHIHFPSGFSSRLEPVPVAPGTATDGRTAAGAVLSLATAEKKAHMPLGQIWLDTLVTVSVPDGHLIGSSRLAVNCQALGRYTAGEKYARAHTPTITSAGEVWSPSGGSSDETKRSPSEDELSLLELDIGRCCFAAFRGGERRKALYAVTQGMLLLGAGGPPVGGFDGSGRATGRMPTGRTWPTAAQAPCTADRVLRLNLRPPQFSYKQGILSMLAPLVDSWWHFQESDAGLTPQSAPSAPSASSALSTPANDPAQKNSASQLCAKFASNEGSTVSTVTVAVAAAVDTIAGFNHAMEGEANPVIVCENLQSKIVGDDDRSRSSSSDSSSSDSSSPYDEPVAATYSGEASESATCEATYTIPAVVGPATDLRGKEENPPSRRPNHLHDDISLHGCMLTMQAMFTAFPAIGKYYSEDGTAEVFLPIFDSALRVLKYWDPEMASLLVWRNMSFALFALPWVTTLMADVLPSVADVQMLWSELFRISKLRLLLTKGQILGVLDHDALDTSLDSFGNTTENSGVVGDGVGVGIGADVGVDVGVDDGVGVSVGRSASRGLDDDQNEQDDEADGDSSVCYDSDEAVVGEPDEEAERHVVATATARGAIRTIPTLSASDSFDYSGAIGGPADSGDIVGADSDSDDSCSCHQPGNQLLSYLVVAVLVEVGKMLFPSRQCERIGVEFLSLPVHYRELCRQLFSEERDGSDGGDRGDDSSDDDSESVIGTFDDFSTVSSVEPAAGNTWALPSQENLLTLFSALNNSQKDEDDRDDLNSSGMASSGLGSTGMGAGMMDSPFAPKQVRLDVRAIVNTIQLLVGNTPEAIFDVNRLQKMRAAQMQMLPPATGGVGAGGVGGLGRRASGVWRSSGGSTTGSTAGSTVGSRESVAGSVISMSSVKDKGRVGGGGVGREGEREREACDEPGEERSIWDSLSDLPLLSFEEMFQPAALSSRSVLLIDMQCGGGGGLGGSGSRDRAEAIAERWRNQRLPLPAIPGSQGGRAIRQYQHQNQNQHQQHQQQFISVAVTVRSFNELKTGGMISYLQAVADDLNGSSYNGSVHTTPPSQHPLAPASLQPYHPLKQQQQHLQQEQQQQQDQLRSDSLDELSFFRRSSFPTGGGASLRPPRGSFDSEFLNDSRDDVAMSEIGSIFFGSSNAAGGGPGRISSFTPFAQLSSAPTATTAAAGGGAGQSAVAYPLQAAAHGNAWQIVLLAPPIPPEVAAAITRSVSSDSVASAPGGNFFSLSSNSSGSCGSGGGSPVNPNSLPHSSSSSTSSSGHRWAASARGGSISSSSSGGGGGGGGGGGDDARSKSSPPNNASGSTAGSVGSGALGPAKGTGTGKFPATTSAQYSDTMAEDALKSLKDLAVLLVTCGFSRVSILYDDTGGSDEKDRQPNG